MYKSKLPTKKLRLSDINELSMAVVICKHKQENEVMTFITETGGIVLSDMRAKGLSRGAMAAAFGMYTEMNVIVAMCQKEIATKFIEDIAQRFKFNEAGNGKSFLVDIEGYMGAKAAFIEGESK